VVYRVALVVAEIVELMMTHDLKRVPVVRDRRLVGSRLGRI
jgi:CBS domain-containing protein